jgi:hypothetical protein
MLKHVHSTAEKCWIARVTTTRLSTHDKTIGGTICCAKQLHTVPAANPCYPPLTTTLTVSQSNSKVSLSTTLVYSLSIVVCS